MRCGFTFEWRGVYWVVSRLMEGGFGGIGGVDEWFG